MGYRLHCFLKEQPEVFRLIDVPDGISFRDLAVALLTVFELPEGNEYAFSVSESKVPVTRAVDFEMRQIEESDISPVKIFQEGHTVFFEFASENVNGEICIEKKKNYPSYQKTVVTLNKGEGMIPGLKGWIINEEGEWEEFENTVPLSVRDVNDLLEEEPPECLPDHAPDLEELTEKNLEELDKETKRLGIDIPELSERMDRESRRGRIIPPRPDEMDEPSPVKKNTQEISDYCRAHPGEALAVETGDFSILDLLSGMPDATRFDFCKYLQLFHLLDRKADEQNKGIWEECRKDPEYLLYYSDPENIDEVAAMSELSGQKTGTCKTETAEGLVALSVARFDSGEKKLVLAREIPELMAGISKKRLSTIKDTVRRFKNGFRILMLHYGLLEIDEVREMLKEYFDLKLSKVQCYRLVYWGYTIPAIIQSGTLMDTGRNYAAERGVDMKKALVELQLTGAMFPYAKIADHEMAGWKRNPADYMNVFAGWTYLYAMLVFRAGLEKETARDLCDNIYWKVRNGAILPDIMEILRAQEEPNNVEEVHISLWEVCLHFLLGTALPALKGANRVIAVHDLRYSMCPSARFTEETVDEDRIVKDTRIENMPERLQAELASRLFTLEEDDLAPMRKIQQRYANNIDINFIVGTAYRRLNHMEEAIRLFRRADRLMNNEKDISVKAVIRACEAGDLGKPLSYADDGVVYIR